MKSWHWTGARFTPVKTVPLTDRGFRYGMSVFESMRVANGAPEFFERHLSRLAGACAERGFDVPEAALRAAERLLKSDGFARIYVTAGDGAPAAGAVNPRIYVFSEPREDVADESWEVTLGEETIRPLFPGLKTGNYWQNLEFLAQARARKFDEVLLFNDMAELVSAACANVFVVHGEKILTPSRSSGCRLGVAREWVVGRRKVEERRLRREHVLDADEVFLTNSWLGVMPVSTVEGRPLGHRFIGPRLAAEWVRRRSEGSGNP